jgi:hypothetical protein
MYCLLLARTRDSKRNGNALFVGQCLVPEIIPSQDVDRLVLQLFNGVVTRYVKMGIGEFLCETRHQVAENQSSPKESR